MKVFVKDLAPLSEVDLALINALQVQCRSSWQRIGETLGISAITAARRWERLVDQGIAWITGYPGVAAWRASCLAEIEVTCSATLVDEVGQALATDPCTLSVDHTSGPCGVLAVVAVPNLAALTTYLRERVGRVNGVTDMRTAPVTQVYTEASQWRLRALGAAELDELSAERASRVEAPARPSVNIHEKDRALLVALGPDGRRDYSTLAQLTGMSRAGVRRRLDRMIQNDIIRFRCEIASSYTEWPILAMFWATVPPQDIDVVGKSLTSLPEIRLCMALSAHRNLIFTAWLRSIADALHMETWLVRRLPQLTIADRAIVLRSYKRMGRILDVQGRSVQAIPMEIWRAPVHTAAKPEPNHPPV